jgi:L-seryl-tRNA(Ser) seleniumtransferase
MDRQSLLRALPKTDDLLRREDLAALAETLPRPLVTDAVRSVIDDVRERILSGDAEMFDDDGIAARVIALATERMRPSLRPVINATGIIVHTNLGRSVLAPEAVEAAARVAAGYSNLEYDIATGERGSRHVHVESLICQLTGAQAAVAVNNNAAAVFLAIAGLACDGEAIVSRGQLVEIGGSFRIPDIMRQTGATMVEVGTTNKTRLKDYERAITPRSALLLKVHSSNFRMVGFTEEASLAELVALGRERGVPVYEDQGSGVLVDLAPYGIAGEPTVRSSIEAGADVVSISGDKLLGGPQAGILAGRRDAIERLKSHPLARALRLDKMTLAALEATLRLYLDPERAVRDIPTLAMLLSPPETVAERARTLASRIAAVSAGAFEVLTEPDTSRAGGGALPMAEIPTTVVTLSPLRTSANALEASLRLGDPTIVARIHEGRVLLDPRTLSAAEEDAVVGRLERIASETDGR